LLNKQVSNQTYAGITKRNIVANNISNDRVSILDSDMNERLSRIESLLLEVAERLTVLEEHVWNKTNADFEQGLYESDGDMSMDEEVEEQVENNQPIINNHSSSEDAIFKAISQLVGHLDSIEKHVSTTIGTPSNTQREEPRGSPQ
jgi:thymidine phosphorylase